ncbi:hypothetical protein Tco_0464885 [Tanacetum coccineum]
MLLFLTNNTGASPWKMTRSVLDDMETSQLASLQELSLRGTQLVIAVAIDKSSGNTSIKSRTTEIPLNFSSSSFTYYAQNGRGLLVIVIDVIKNSTCYKAFTISAEVPEIFMQQFCYTFKKVKDTESYEFLLANKKCVVDVEVFRKILNICPRVQGVDFAELPDDEATLTFLLSLGYKGPLHKHPSMYVDHMHQPWRTLASIINKCLSGKTTSNDRLRKSRINILWGMFYRENLDYPELIWEDFAFQIDYRLKFVRISKDYQEYGLPIPETMLTEVIKQSESYQMFIKYYTSQIPPKKSRGKDVALELGKSMSLTEATEEEASRQVHATHARIVTEPVTEPAKRRPSCIAFRDTSNVTKKMSHDPSKKLKGVQTLTPKEQLAADTMKALKESKKTSRRQPSTRGSSKGTGVSPGVPDESTFYPCGGVWGGWGGGGGRGGGRGATSSEGTGTNPGVPDEEKVTFKANVILEWGSEQERENDEEENDDEFAHAKEMPERTKEVKDDAKKAELPPTSSSLSVSSGFGDQFLKLSSDTSLISTSPSILIVPVLVISEPSALTPILETPSVAHATTLLPPPSVSTIPHVLLQTTTPIPSPPIIDEALTITTAVPESDAFNVVQLRVEKLGKDVSELKKIDHSAKALATLKSQRHTADLIQKYSLKPSPEPSKIQTSTIDFELEYKKSASDIFKIKKEQA